jgi:hypothetical protein
MGESSAMKSLQKYPLVTLLHGFIAYPGFREEFGDFRGTVGIPS